MNIIPFFSRNKFPKTSENRHFLLTSPYFQKNRIYTHYSKEKSNIILNGKTKSNIYKSPKYTKSSNLIIDYKKNSKKAKLINDKFKYLKTNTFLIQNYKLNSNDSNSNLLETESNKIINNKFYNENNKSSGQLLLPNSIYKNQFHNMSIKKNNNFISNTSNSTPKSNKIEYYHNRGINMNLSNSFITKNKNQSFKNLNKIVNKDFPNFPNLLNIKEDYNYKKNDYDNKKGEIHKNNNQRNNLYVVKRSLSSFSSNINLRTKNNINSKYNNNNNNFNQNLNSNYNIPNKNYSKGRNNSYSNIYIYQKTPKINYINLSFFQYNRNNIQNMKKYQKREKDYSYNQKDSEINKIYLNKYYEDIFNNDNISNDDKKTNIKIDEENKSKYNKEVIYKKNLTKNYSTFINRTRKIKNMKQFFYSKSIINEEDSNIDNFEEIHFFIISSIQKGKNYSKNFN